jgi:hypothetical protein
VGLAQAGEQGPQRPGRVHEELVLGDDQHVQAAAQFALGQPRGHLAEQIAIPADEIDQAGRAARLGGDPLEVPLIQADPVVVDQALAGGDGQGGRRSAGQGRRDVGEDALRVPLPGRRRAEAGAF